MRMHIWAIADLHLSFAAPKPMDVFGEAWRNHPDRIAAAWNRVVKSDDVVLIPGDISWALRLEAALPDLQWIDTLPGHKVITKGNHDYWWDYARKRRSELPKSLTLIEADAVRVGNWVLCGTRGWVTPGHPNWHPETDERIYLREIGRLRRALAAAERLRQGDEKLGVLLHYPPFLPEGSATAFADEITQAGATFCVYGHLHRRHDWRQAVQGVCNGVEYFLTSCDFLDFTPRPIVAQR
ncbi:MAG: metallophosphoesterase [Herpetosiphon sp.]